MSKLQDQIESSKTALAEFPSSPPTGSLLPLVCFEKWKKIATIHKLLEGTKPLFLVKDKAWNALTELRQTYPVLPSEQYREEFEGDRHYALVEYNAVAWSIYDRLADICGRLVAICTISPRSQKNPKLVEHIMKEGKENVVGVTLQHQILNAYGWPIKVSYTIRNWLVHEGFERSNANGTNVKLFDNAPFDISESAKELITTEATEAGVQQSFCCLGDNTDSSDKGDPTDSDKKDDLTWKNGNLIEILQTYHEEIDTMFTALLKWSTASFVAQIDAFQRL
ncbi:MAG: hypothetical protein ACRC10_10760 [Thermoguttaceae bacterium]